MKIRKVQPELNAVHRVHRLISSLYLLIIYIDYSSLIFRCIAEEAKYPLFFVDIVNDTSVNTGYCNIQWPLPCDVSYNTIKISHNNEGF